MGASSGRGRLSGCSSSRRRVAGGSLGAAALAHVHLTGCRHSDEPLERVNLGPRYTADEVASVLAATGLEARDFRHREADLLEAVVDRLEARIVC